MKKIISLGLGLLLAFTLIGCGTQAPSPHSPGTGTSSELMIAAAASLTEPLNELIGIYAAVNPNVKIIPTYGGSGALQTQIEQGAPIDIFFPAAARQMDALENKDLIIASSKVNLLKNEIVLIIPSELPVQVGSFGDVATEAVQKIALGDPSSVPAGQYAQETLTALNLWDQITAKATYGSDVRQVLSWVADGSVDCGIVYKTDALSDKNVQIIAEAPNGSHTPIVYPIAVVKASAHQDAAQDFIKYLQSKDATAVFEKYGFMTA